jgi:monoamine oxidase
MARRNGNTGTTSPDSLERRNFLKQSTALTGLGLAATGLTAPAIADSSKKKAQSRHDFDVIVIGCGFAGATAARELGTRGYRTLVLEARSRLGGRTFTSQFAGEQVELGGTWIHWLQPHVWAEMERYGLGLEESPALAPERSILLARDGSREELSGEKARAFFGKMASAYEKFNHDAKKYFPRPYEPFFREGMSTVDNLSAADRLNALDITTAEKDMVASLLSVFSGGPLKQTALAPLLKVYGAGGFNFASFMETQSVYKISGGTIALINAMIEDSGAKVVTSTPVSGLKQLADGVQVTVDDDRIITASAAVVTVPINVYKTIDFDPPLSGGKKAMATDGQLSQGIKVYVKLKENVGTLWGMGSAEQPFTLLQTEKYGENGSILIAFGPSREALDINDGDAVAAQIRRYLPGVTVESSMGYDWNYDPFALSPWPAYRVGQMSAHLRELQKPEGRIHFAGSLTANGWHEWIDGAVESGLRAAREISAIL